MKKCLVVWMLMAGMAKGFAQNSDTQYKLPLKDALQQVEKRFGIALRYTDEMVNSK